MTRVNSDEIEESTPRGTETPRDERTVCRVRDDESVTQAVVRAVSAKTKSAGAELEPLYSAVDPDALNRLFAPLESGGPRRPNGTVSFRYAEYEVTVTSDGLVEID